MRLTKEYNMNSDRDADLAKLESKASEMYAALHDICNGIRQLDKYSNFNQEETTIVIEKLRQEVSLIVGDLLED